MIDGCENLQNDVSFFKTFWEFMNPGILNILVCPVSKAKLGFSADRKWLLCKASGLAYPIKDGVPVLLESEARRLSVDEQLD